MGEVILPAITVLLRCLLFFFFFGYIFHYHCNNYYFSLSSLFLFIFILWWARKTLKKIVRVPDAFYVSSDAGLGSEKRDGGDMGSSGCLAAAPDNRVILHNINSADVIM